MSFTLDPFTTDTSRCSYTSTVFPRLHPVRPSERFTSGVWTGTTICLRSGAAGQRFSPKKLSTKPAFADEADRTNAGGSAGIPVQTFHLISDPLNPGCLYRCYCVLPVHPGVTISGADPSIALSIPGTECGEDRDFGEAEAGLSVLVSYGMCSVRVEEPVALEAREFAETLRRLEPSIELLPREVTD